MTDTMLPCALTTLRFRGGGGRVKHSVLNMFSMLSQFHAVFHKIWQSHMLVSPPGGLALPPMGNPGSAPALRVVRVKRGVVRAKRSMLYPKA